MSDPTLSFRIDGLQQLEENLRRLQSDVAAKWVNGALRSGVKTIQIAAKGTTAFRDQSGTLRQTIRIRRGKRISDDNRREYFAIAGSRVKGGGGAYYAHMVELGTKPHTIRAKNRGRLNFGGGYFSSVQHPGAKPTHFMESAARRTTDAAVSAFASYIRTKLARSGMLVPGSETE